MPILNIIIERRIGTYECRDLSHPINVVTSALLWTSYIHYTHLVKFSLYIHVSAVCNNEIYQKILASRSRWKSITFCEKFKSVTNAIAIFLLSRTHINIRTLVMNHHTFEFNHEIMQESLRISRMLAELRFPRPRSTLNLRFSFIILMKPAITFIHVS